MKKDCLYKNLDSTDYFLDNIILIDDIDEKTIRLTRIIITNKKNSYLYIFTENHDKLAFNKTINNLEESDNESKKIIIKSAFTIDVLTYNKN